MATSGPHSSFDNLSPISVGRQVSLSDFYISWIGFDGQNERAREEVQEDRAGIFDISAETQN